MGRRQTQLDNLYTYYSMPGEESKIDTDKQTIIAATSEYLFLQ